MIGLVLVTHGRLAAEFVVAMEHVVGPQEAIEAICIGADDDMEARRQDIADAIGRVRDPRGSRRLNALRREVQITNQRGLHARASAKFVNLASGLDATVEVEKDGNKVCGTSIMGLMMLGAALGDSITILVSGTNAEDALEKLATLVEERFGE